VIILFFTAVSTAAGLEDRSDDVEGTGEGVDAAANAGLEDSGDGVGDGVEGTSDRVDAASTRGGPPPGGSAVRAFPETETDSFNP
jgi:hypothetical protein